MTESFYEATMPSKEKPAKEGFGLFRWLDRHPRLVLPLAGISYTLFLGMVLGLIILVN